MKKILLALGLTCLASQTLALDFLGVYDKNAPEGCLSEVNLNQKLTLPVLIQIGICNNPSLNREFMAVKASEAQLGVQRSEYLPTISASGNASRTYKKQEDTDSERANPFSANVALNWMLYDFGGRGATTEQTKNYLQQAEFTYNALLHDTVLAINQAYFDLLSNEAVLKSAQETVKSYKKSFEETTKRYELGMVSLSDKLLAQTTYQKSELEVIAAQNSIEKSRANLATLLNLPTDTKFDLQQPSDKKDFEKLEQDIPVQEMMELALKLRPELSGALSAREAAQQGVYIARAGYFPTISAVANAGYGDTWKHQSPYQKNASVGLSIDVPLFSGFQTSYLVDKAKFYLKQAQADVIKVSDMVKEEVYTSYQDYQTAVSSYKVNQQVLASAKEGERVSFASYQAGKESILNLLTAQAQLASARKEVVVSYYNVLISKANLYRAIGQF